MRESTTYNKLVGRIGDDYYFCDNLFRYDDSLQGATGTVLRPVSQAEYDDRTDRDTLKEYLEEVWREMVAARQTDQGLDDWAEMAIDVDGVDHCAGFDLSGEHLWPQLRSIGITEDEYPMIECTGGGRCFSREQQFDEVYDADLLAKILEIEVVK